MASWRGFLAQLGTPRQAWTEFIVSQCFEKGVGVWTPYLCPEKDVHAGIFSDKQCVSTCGDYSCEDHVKQCLPDTDAFDYAASVQEAFTTVVMRSLTEALQAFRGEIDGLVLSGGCAMNSVLNEHMRTTLDVPVYIASNVIDSALAVGAALFAMPPPRRKWGAKRPPHLYTGLLPFDTDVPQDSYMYAKVKRFKRADLKLLETHPTNARVTKPSADDLVELLLRGAVLALVRGRQEFGLSKYTHRAVLAAPSVGGSAEKMRRLGRLAEWMTVPTVMTAPFAESFLNYSVHSSGVTTSFGSFAVRPPNRTLMCRALAPVLCGRTQRCFPQATAPTP